MCPAASPLQSPVLIRPLESGSESLGVPAVIRLWPWQQQFARHREQSECPVSSYYHRRQSRCAATQVLNEEGRGEGESVCVCVCTFSQRPRGGLYIQPLTCPGQSSLFDFSAEGPAADTHATRLETRQHRSKGPHLLEEAWGKPKPESHVRPVTLFIKKK